MKKATRLRPSEGGKMRGPVGPASGVERMTNGDIIGAVAEHDDPIEMALLLRTVSEAPDWLDEVSYLERRERFVRSLERMRDRAPVSLPPAAPVDEELERERARLIGKRVNGGRGYADGCTVVEVDKRHDGVLRARLNGESGRPAWVSCELHPIPDDKPEVCFFGDLEVGERFVLIGIEGGGWTKTNTHLSVEDCTRTTWWHETDAAVRRIKGTTSGTREQRPSPHAKKDRPHD